ARVGDARIRVRRGGRPAERRAGGPDAHPRLGALERGGRARGAARGADRIGARAAFGRSAVRERLHGRHHRRARLTRRRRARGARGRGAADRRDDPVGRDRRPERDPRAARGGAARAAAGHLLAAEGAPGMNTVRRILTPATPGHRWGLTAVLLVLAIAGTFLLDPYRNYLLATLAAYVCGTAGLSLLVGRTGQLSLGHAAFMAAGAYGFAFTSNAMADAPGPL